jgi:hypothetical protein
LHLIGLQASTVYVIHLSSSSLGATMLIASNQLRSQYFLGATYAVPLLSNQSPLKLRDRNLLLPSIYKPSQRWEMLSSAGAAYRLSAYCGNWRPSERIQLFARRICNGFDAPADCVPVDKPNGVQLTGCRKESCTPGLSEPEP